jgi:hypothetical protein
MHGTRGVTHCQHQRFKEMTGREDGKLEDFSWVLLLLGLCSLMVYTPWVNCLG